jgi:septal ring factor EnvC (AmiA/AmiB activator)
MLTVISLWDKERKLRETQKEIQEKEAMLEEQRQKIAVLEARLASSQLGWLH